jgi:hypothetical protein
MVKFVASVVIFISKLSEDFKPLVERAKKVAAEKENETEEELVARLAEGAALMIDASIIAVSNYAQTIADPEKKEELMQQAWRIRSLGDFITKAMKEINEKGSVSMGETLELVNKLQKMTSPENVGDVKVVKIFEEIN